MVARGASPAKARIVAHGHRHGGHPDAASSPRVDPRAGVRRRQFLQDGDLPFTKVLTEQIVADALTAVGGRLDRIFSPLVTLWVFLGTAFLAALNARLTAARPVVSLPVVTG